VLDEFARVRLRAAVPLEETVAEESASDCAEALELKIIRYIDVNI